MQRFLRRAALVALLASFFWVVVAVPVQRALPAQAQAPRLVLAFYYAWFDANTWTPSKVPDFPVERYLSSDRQAIERHVSQAQGAGIDAFVQSWWGPNNPTDTNFATLLDVAATRGFRATVDFELTSPLFRNRGDAVNALRYFMERYGSHPALLRWNDRPVLFFWRQGNYSIGDWAAIRKELDPTGQWIWIAEGVDIRYQQVFDGHHMYSVAWSPDPAAQLRKVGDWVRGVEPQWGDRIWVATAMPGYDDTRTGRANAFVRPRANGSYYRATWQGAQESRADWVIITSWNEWPEGSYIEPSERYGDSYLTLTAELAAAFRAGSPASPPAAPAQPAPVSAPARSPGATNWAIPGGRFFTEAGGGAGGFAVLDDGAARMWAAFQQLGGVQGVGYPISRRFERDGFVTQAFQKAVVQWRPAEGRAVLVNVFDELSRAGLDGALAGQFQTPAPLPAGWDGGAVWAEVVARRQALLEANPALRQRYFSTSDPLTVFGLPTSAVTDQGSHYAIRLQRAVLQQWKSDVPWAKAGEVTVANGGDLAKALGWLPAEALTTERVDQ